MVLIKQRAIINWIQEQDEVVPCQDVCNAEAKYGHLKILKWIEKQSEIMPDQDCANNAMCNRQLEVLL